MPTTVRVPEVPPITFRVDTGTLYLGDQEVVGLASRDMVEATAYEISSPLQERVTELESELRELRQLRSIFTADFARELVKRCERFVDNQELTGMTDEEFEAEIGNLLLSGGV